MQDKRHVDVKKILLSLAQHLGVKGIRGLAKELGESENRLYAWVKNGNIADTGAILVKCPNIRRGWLQTGEGEMFETKFRDFAEIRIAEGREKEARAVIRQFPSRPVQVPVLGRISAGFPNIANDEVIGYVYLPDAPSNSYSLIVHGDCMEPNIKDGDHVLFIADGDYKLGDVLVVLNEWGDATLKRLKEKEGAKYLVPDNPSFPTISPNEHFRIIGKVVKVWRDVRF